MGKHAEALADFTRAIELDPKNALTRFLRAYLASTQGGAVGDDAQMRRRLARGDCRQPGISRRRMACWRCISRNQGDNLPEALKLAQKASGARAGQPIYQIDLAQVLARMNRYAEARKIALHARGNATNPMEQRRGRAFSGILDQVSTILERRFRCGGACCGAGVFRHCSGSCVGHEFAGAGARRCCAPATRAMRVKALPSARGDGRGDEAELHERIEIRIETARGR